VLEGLWLGRGVQKLAALAISAAAGARKVGAYLGPVVSWQMLLVSELVVAMGKAALFAERTLQSESPVATFLV